MAVYLINTVPPPFLLFTPLAQHPEQVGAFGLEEEVRVLC